MNMYLVSREDKAHTVLFIIAPHLEAMKQDTLLYTARRCLKSATSFVRTVAVRPAALCSADRYAELESGHLCVNRVFLAN